ncbi:MAG: hypothetical protein SOZ08_07540 [Erysipelotrichaceae bacterium]|nr:hypothetical protein [Erysipelotrichaceae bacterium]
MQNWKECKKRYYRKTCLVAFEGGVIDFSPTGMKHVLRAEKLSYDDYLEIQYNSIGHTRKYFEQLYVAGNHAFFMGQIQRRSNSKIVFRRIMINGMRHDGICFIGKEDHVWMNQEGFDNFDNNECVRFNADIYRYMKTGNGRQFDYALRNPSNIEKIDSYNVPTDQELIDQQINDLVCESCMYHDHCYMGNCIMNQIERQKRIKFLKNLQPGKFTPLTVIAAFELEGRMFEQTGLFPKLSKDDPNYPVMKKILDYAASTPYSYVWPLDDLINHLYHPTNLWIFIE